jgi:AraC-like DNA-binding protein
VAVEGTPAPSLRGLVATSYHGFEELAPGPVRRREGPGSSVVVILSFGKDWLIDGQRLTSFAAGLRLRQVTTEHAGHSFGMHVNLAPAAARMLFGMPLHELAQRAIPLGHVLGEPNLVARLHDAGSWPARFRMLDSVLQRRFADARPPPAEIVWAWRRLVESGGRIPVKTLCEELDWSRKRIAARFRDHVGLPPKAASRLLRFERTRTLVERSERPDWARLALDCGYYDQSHLINDFRSFTGRTPETFFQDVTAPAA